MCKVIVDGGPGIVCISPFVRQNQIRFQFPVKHITVIHGNLIAVERRTFSLLDNPFLRLYSFASSSSCNNTYVDLFKSISLTHSLQTDTVAVKTKELKTDAF